MNQGESRLFFMTEHARTIRLGQGGWCTPTGRQAKDTPGRRPGQPGGFGQAPIQRDSNRFKWFQTDSKHFYKKICEPHPPSPKSYGATGGPSTTKTVLAYGHPLALRFHLRLRQHDATGQMRRAKIQAHKSLNKKTIQVNPTKSNFFIIDIRMTIYDTSEMTHAKGARRGGVNTPPKN
ncbi:MAG TPA: hypothetical protein VK815_04100 [Candidatus Acidoferrales bacterium]|nr:hypothetical protein [Candidatus Acidoferrales bacterium]